MKNPYHNFLSPIPVGGLVFKNRMVSTNSLPHFLQGPELFPSEAVISHMSGIAKNGAAMVTFADWTNMEQRIQPKEDGTHFPMYDITDPSVHNYIGQLADGVHFYQSYISVAIQYFGARDKYLYDAPAVDSEKVEQLDLLEMQPCDRAVAQFRNFQGYFGALKGYTAEDIEAMADEIAQRVRFYQLQGFDMVTIHMAYRLTTFSLFLSPISNTRTDEFGGSLENRARFPLMTCRKIKELCGKDFPIEIQICGEEEPGGLSQEDVLEFARMAEGLIDIFQFRAKDADLSHPTGFNSVKEAPLTVPYAEALKKSGIKVLAEVVGGFQDLEQNEAIIREGKADLIGMARTFICEPEYMKKALEGRGDDVAPCVRCNKCHVPSLTGPWISYCTINPRMGLEHRLDRMISPPDRVKRVAVIGGGPAGMKAAITAAERGHQVTLFEATDYLGGQLRHTDSASFKWPLRNFKNYLVAQMEKAGVEVRLNSRATPETVAAEGFDAVIAATGAEPKFPKIPGLDPEKVWDPQAVFGNEKKLGKTVVVVGGSETGTETAMYLAMNGHDVTILTRQDMLASDATPIHYVESMTTAWKELDNFHPIFMAKTTAVGENGVTYVDESGAEHQICADSIVVCGGVRSRLEEALSFQGTSNEFYMIGDCKKPGNVQKCMRQAFSAGSQI